MTSSKLERECFFCVASRKFLIGRPNLTFWSRVVSLILVLSSVLLYAKLREEAAALFDLAFLFSFFAVLFLMILVLAPGRSIQAMLLLLRTGAELKL